MTLLPFTLLFWVRIYTPFLCFLSREYPLVEINAKETKETIAKINKAKSWFFERIHKIDKPLARLIKKQRGKKSNQ